MERSNVGCSQPYFRSFTTNTLLLFLPDRGKVNVPIAKTPEEPNEIIPNSSVVVLQAISETQYFALDVTSVGTRFQGATTHSARSQHPPLLYLCTFDPECIASKSKYAISSI